MSRQVFFIFGFLVGTFTMSEAYTSTYECKDTESNFSFYVNIDNNSLHFKNGDSLWVLDYNKTINIEDKSNMLMHIFKQGNVDFLVFQNKTNPIDIYIDDYKDNKIKYKYKCKLENILKNNNEIPITWKDINSSKKILEQSALGSHADTKKFDIKKFYQNNLDAHIFCSAIYYIKTAVPKEEQNKAQIYQNYGELFQYLASLYFKELTNKTANIGTIMDMKEKYLELLKHEYKKTHTLSKDAFIKYGQCERIIIDINNNSTLYKNIKVSTNNQILRKKLLLNDLAITNKKQTDINKKQLEQYLNIWINKHDAMTPKKLRQKLQNLIKQGGTKK